MHIIFPQNALDCIFMNLRIGIGEERKQIDIATRNIPLIASFVREHNVIIFILI